MAFLQRAWVFRPIASHRAIADAVLDDGRVDTERLNRLARAVMADERSRPYLEMLRLDSPPAVVEELDTVWAYVVALGADMTPVRSLEDLAGVATDYLYGLGWPAERVDLLLWGEPLSLLQDLVDDPLIDEVAPQLTLQYGGWLSPELATDLRAHLTAAAAEFHEPTDGAVRRCADAWRRDPGDVRRSLVRTYESAAALLERAAELPTDSALRCLAD